MTNKSTTVKPVVEIKEEVVAKPAPILHEHKLVLPSDPGGFSSNMRREIARAVGRIAGDEVKLQSFLGTLEIFSDFAKNKAEQQRNDLKTKIADKGARLAMAKAQVMREAEGIIASKRIAANKLNAEIKAHDARKEATK